jgi:hypothetical protein
LPKHSFLYSINCTSEQNRVACVHSVLMPSSHMRCCPPARELPKSQPQFSSNLPLQWPILASSKHHLFVEQTLSCKRMAQQYHDDECILNAGPLGHIEGLTISDQNNNPSRPLIHYFGGLPYALPPIGQHRFRKPRPLPDGYRYGTQTSPGRFNRGAVRIRRFLRTQD